MNRSVLNHASAAGLAIPRAAPAQTQTGKSVVSVSVTFSSVERWPGTERSPEACVETTGLGRRAERGKERERRRSRRRSGSRSAGTGDQTIQLRVSSSPLRAPRDAGPMHWPHRTHKKCLLPKERGRRERSQASPRKAKSEWHEEQNRSSHGRWPMKFFLLSFAFSLSSPLSSIFGQANTPFRVTEHECAGNSPGDDGPGGEARRAEALGRDGGAN